MFDQQDLVKIANYEMPNHLRISIGTENENQFFIKALGEILNNV